MFDLTSAEDALRADATFRVARNSLATTSVYKAGLNRDAVLSVDKTMQVQLDKWAVANQKRSGRCWIFAGLNSLRAGIMRETRLQDFELSQTFVHFWDKLEKANYFLSATSELADRPLTDRTVCHLLGAPIDDGGQWNMFVALVEKYGVVPQSAMPETYSSSHTASMNRQLEAVLRRGAMRLRAGEDNAREETMRIVYRILSVHLGTPPENFQWSYRDKDDNFHSAGTFTPRTFAQRYLPDLAEHVCVVNDPRHEFGRLYTVEYLGNVVGAKPVTYLNAPIEVLKDAVRAQLDAGQPVWFGCDTLAHSDADLGIWAKDLFAYGDVYRVPFGMTKRERVERGDSMMTHAMVFTGYGPGSFRVENSWGPDKADKGFWTMTEEWFDEYVFEIAVPAHLLPETCRAGLDTPVTALPAWDPMGALAH